MTKRVFHQFENMKLDDYQPVNDSQAQARQVTEDYLANLDLYREKGKGLTFIGPAGVGKTMLAAIVLNRAATAGYRIECLTLSTYVQMILNKMQVGRLAMDDEDLLDRWLSVEQHLREIKGTYRKKTADWVLFDDVGRDYSHYEGTGWSNFQFHDVVRYRYDHGLPTLLTSNMPLQEWADVYSDSMASFLHEATTIVTILGDDYRWSEDS